MPADLQCILIDPHRLSQKGKRLYIPLRRAYRRRYPNATHPWSFFVWRSKVGRNIPFDGYRKLNLILRDSCILDGEMLVYDPLLGRYLAFGTLKSAALGTFIVCISLVEAHLMSGGTLQIVQINRMP